MMNHFLVSGSAAGGASAACSMGAGSGAGDSTAGSTCADSAACSGSVLSGSVDPAGESSHLNCSSSCILICLLERLLYAVNRVKHRLINNIEVGGEGKN